MSTLFALEVAGTTFLRVGALARVVCFETVESAGKHQDAILDVKKYAARFS